MLLHHRNRWLYRSCQYLRIRQGQGCGYLPGLDVSTLLGDLDDEAQIIQEPLVSLPPFVAFEFGKIRVWNLWCHFFSVRLAM